MSPRKPSRKALTNKLDFTWSRLIRSRGSCERCGRTNCKLDAAHIVGRQNRRLRWDVRNGWSACFLCHRWNHDHPLEFAAWILEHRPADVDYLMRVKNEVTNYTTSDYQEMLAKLEVSLELEAAKDLGRRAIGIEIEERKGDPESCSFCDCADWDEDIFDAFNERQYGRKWAAA